MPHPSKKQRMTDDGAGSSSQALLGVATAGDLSVDVLANILGFLDGPKDIMQKRRVCKKWKEAVKKTTSPLVEFHVESTENYNAMTVMTRALPNLQQIKIGGVCNELKYNDGEDPDEERAACKAHETSHDIEIISNFSKLQILEIDFFIVDVDLNGRYPFLFNSFPLLQKLSFDYCSHLKWDLGMLAGFPLLKELYCWQNRSLTGNISSLRVLKDTLEKVTIKFCQNVEGNFMDLADFPHLKELNLGSTSVTGDIRDIGENDFSSLESLNLPKGVYGGNKNELQRISDAPDLMRALYLLKKQRPALKISDWYGILSEDSPDWYDTADFDVNYLQFSIHFVKAGTRVGYQWQTNGHWCEVNWLDPEPDRESSDYSKYIEELEQINSQVTFRGFYQPPTEEEYHRLWGIVGW